VRRFGGRNKNSARTLAVWLPALLSGKHAARKLMRAQIPLAAEAGASQRDQRPATVYRAKRRFLTRNLDLALSEEPRRRADRKLLGKEEALPVATACISI
jgi:hypothetical protein